MSRANWTDDRLIYRLLNNKTDKSRWANISALRKRPSKELFSKCMELIQSKDAKTRQIGIDILAQFGLPPRPFLNETLKIYFDLLDIETDVNVLMSLLFAIGHNNGKLNKEQVYKICAFADHNNIDVKQSVVFALLGVDRLNAIKSLIKLSSDKSSHIRNWATFGLGSLIEKDNKNIRQALWNRVNDKHEETRFEAIVGLAKRKDYRIKDIIKREFMSDEYGSLIFEAIIEIQDKDFLPLLEQKLELIQQEENINQEWINSLKNCIDELKKITLNS